MGTQYCKRQLVGIDGWNHIQSVLVVDRLGREWRGILGCQTQTLMLDRSQHLKLFLTGSGDNQEDIDVVLTDKRVQKELNRHPVNWERLFNAMRRVSHFKFNSAQEDHFMWVFS